MKTKPKKSYSLFRSWQKWNNAQAKLWTKTNKWESLRVEYGSFSKAKLELRLNYAFFRQPKPRKLF